MKTETINLKVSEEEKYAINEAAFNARMSTNVWIRSVLFENIDSIPKKLDATEKIVYTNPLDIPGVVKGSQLQDAPKPFFPPPKPRVNNWEEPTIDVDKL